MRLEQRIQSRKDYRLQGATMHGSDTIRSGGKVTVRSGTRRSREVTCTQKRSTILKSKMTCILSTDPTGVMSATFPASRNAGSASTKALNTKMYEKSQDFTGRLADEAVKAKKWEEQQSVRPVVHCQGAPVANVYKFTYLGCLFACRRCQPKL